jgi:hypothetical protein
MMNELHQKLIKDAKKLGHDLHITSRDDAFAGECMWCGAIVWAKGGKLGGGALANYCKLDNLAEIMIRRIPLKMMPNLKLNKDDDLFDQVRSYAMNMVVNGRGIIAVYEQFINSE